MQFHFTSLISFPVQHIYVSLSLLLDGWCSGLAHSKQGISLGFSYYENGFPRQRGHGHSPSSSCYLRSVCITSLWNQASPKHRLAQCSLLTSPVLVFGICPSPVFTLFLKTPTTSHGVTFLLRHATAAEASIPSCSISLHKQKMIVDLPLKVT